jgi:hypothetical protein
MIQGTKKPIPKLRKALPNHPCHALGRSLTPVGVLPGGITSHTDYKMRMPICYLLSDLTSGLLWRQLQ